MKKRPPAGFTLVELIVVLGIMAVLLVLGGTLFTGAGDTQNRKAARSLVASIFNNAQGLALSTGEPVAVVLMPYTEGGEDLRGKGISVFEVREDEATDRFIGTKQIRKWTGLPGRFILVEDEPAFGAGQNAFDVAAITSVEVKNPDSGLREMVEVPAVIFGGAGNVIWPSGSGELELQIGEGLVEDGTAIARGEAAGEAAKLELFIISRQTGRIRLVETE